MSSKSMEEYLKKYQDGGQTKKRKKTKKAKNGSMMIVEDDTFTAVASTAKQIEYSDEEESEDEIQLALAEKIKRAKKACFKGTFETVEVVPLSEQRSSNAKFSMGSGKSGKGSSKRKPDSSDADDASPPRARRRHDSDNDPSPPRRRRLPSPPRRGRSRRDSKSDRSPPRRRRRHDSDESPPRSSKQTKDKDREDKSKTFDGKKSGLQSAKAVREENERLRQAETKFMQNMDEDRTGRNAETVYRSKMTGKGRANKDEDERKARECEKQEELNQLYKSQNRGVKQIRDREEKLAEMAEIIKEDFTRYADNEKMNEHLKDQLFEEDPMFLMKMKERRTADVHTGTAVPIYQGHWPQNRFSIRPGYRWDGVDRSSGFEAKLALQANRKKAEQSEYYKMVAELD